jgi:hypothetical protein
LIEAELEKLFVKNCGCLTDRITNGYHPSNA